MKLQKYPLFFKKKKSFTILVFKFLIKFDLIVVTSLLMLWGLNVGKFRQSFDNF